MMKIDYNVTGEQRKKLVEAISKDGIVEVDENEPTLALFSLLEGLYGKAERL